MRQRVVYHGIVDCPICGRIYDVKGDPATVATVANKHADPHRGPGHGCTQSVHVIEACTPDRCPDLVAN